MNLTPKERGVRSYESLSEGADIFRGVECHSQGSPL